MSLVDSGYPTFRPELVWGAMMALLATGLGGDDQAFDVQPVSEKDFNGDDLILNPPSVRTFFAEAVADPMQDSQRLSYEATSRFVALCGDEDRSDPGLQALASLALASDVVELLAGARVVLSSGEQSEPVRYISTTPVPVAGFGTAYAVAFEVPGLAQYPGPNANPVSANPVPGGQ